MIGLTATIPLEILIAAEQAPLDLNRLFLEDSSPEDFIEEAELAGFPVAGCNLVKGLYGAALRHGAEQLVIATGGECAGSRSLLEILALHDIRVIPFHYPLDRSPDSLAHEIKKLARHFNASPVEINQARLRLNGIREKAIEIDRLCWQENKVSGAETQRYLLATRDMRGNPERFERELDQFIAKAGKRAARKETLRLAYLGAPPLFGNLAETFEELGARIVYHEFAHQTSMPEARDSLVEQYRSYTPACDIFTRLETIERQRAQRGVHGIIHGLHSPCSGQIEDLILRQRLKAPLLTLQTGRPGPVDTYTRLQIEAFVARLQELTHT